MSCCPSIWWCTPTGPVEVEPDGDDVYTRPDDATGHPFKSLADALEVCPPPPFVVECPADVEWTLPGGIFANFGSQNGMDWPNSVFMVSIPPSGGAIAAYAYVGDLALGTYPVWVASVAVYCVSGGLEFRFFFSPTAIMAGLTGAGAGWGYFTTYLSKTFATPADLTFPQNVGTVQFITGSGLPPVPSCTLILST